MTQFTVSRRSLYAALTVSFSMRVPGQFMHPPGSGRKAMVHKAAVAVAQAATLILVTATSAPAAGSQFGTEAEARAMLEKAAAAVKADKNTALEMFNKGEAGSRPLRVVRQRLGRRSDGASLPEGRTSAGDQGQEGVSARERDHGERHGGTDQDRDVLVAPPRYGNAARE